MSSLPATEGATLFATVSVESDRIFRVIARQ